MLKRAALTLGGADGMYGLCRDFLPSRLRVTAIG
jgi:hypothetical protein